MKQDPTDIDGVAESLEATQRSREVVGLYGDPSATWGISVEVTFTDQVDLGDAEERLTALCSDYPHLGLVPEVEVISADTYPQVREQVASAELGLDGRLVRLLASSDGRTFFITAHHGVCDGLGLLSIASALVGRELTSSARGVGDRSSPQGFLLSSLVRLGEALFNPPARFSGSGRHESAGAPESLLQESAVFERVNGAAVCAALTRVYAAWPRGRSSGGRRFLAVMGASRRPAGKTAPDRQTAYLRIPLKAGSNEAQAAEAIRSVDPEPDFPETSAGGIGPMVMSALKNRLGYTVNVSNLGLVSGDGVESLAMFPAVNGPQAVGIGVVSTSHTTMLSLRTRRTDFTDDEARTLLRLLLDEMR